MKFVAIFLFLFVTSCASRKIIKIDDQLSSIIHQKNGMVLLVNLNTHDRVKRGKVCRLILKSASTSYGLELKEGAHAYGIPRQLMGFRMEELNCGPFYYYKFKEDLVAAPLKSQKVHYLGDIDFELQEKGHLEWGRKKSSSTVFKQQVQSLGLNENETIIIPIKL